MKKFISVLLCAITLLTLMVTPAFAASEKTTLEVQKVTANCTSEPYGKAVNSFTYTVNSTAEIMGLTAADFETKHCVYDAMETKAVFDAKALNVSFTANTVTVEVAPFYPNNSFSRQGYWVLECTNPALNIDACSEIVYSDPTVEAFKKFTHTYGEATMDCYLYTPENAVKNMPLLVFNSGGSGISTTGDIYGANFPVSFAKEDAQAIMPCYVLYPQRNAGSTDELCAGTKEIIDGLIADGKVDANRVYMTGESAGSLFTMNFVSRYPGYNAAIVIFDGGGSYAGATLKETMSENAESPFSDKEMKQLAKSGTKVMLVQSLGDTTSMPIKYATTYSKLVEYGMVPGTDIFWHYYTAEQFNALLGDNTVWAPMADAGYITDPITGKKTYYYPEGKLHNASYPAANDQYIKLWLMTQSKAEYSVAFSKEYSAQASTVDYSVIPQMYTKYAVLKGAPGIPSGSTTTLTVYTDDSNLFYYISFNTFFKKETQYVEAIAVNGKGHTIMDCSGTWWTVDVDNFMMPYILSQDIQWLPYEGPKK